MSVLLNRGLAWRIRRSRFMAMWWPRRVT
jgi:hypothetical protein